MALFELVDTHEVAEQVAIDVFHHDVGGRAPEWNLVTRAGFFISRVKNSDDRGVGHLRGSHGLEAESVTKSRVVGEVGFQDFDRYLPTEASVGTEIHICHATASDELANFIATVEESASPWSGGNRVHVLVLVFSGSG